VEVQVRKRITHSSPTPLRLTIQPPLIHGYVLVDQGEFVVGLLEVYERQRSRIGLGQ